MKTHQKIYILALVHLFTFLTNMTGQPANPVKNSVTTIIALSKVTDDSSLNASNSLTTIQYTDGLGMPNITVMKGITPDKKDLVSVITHGTGDTSYEWLPVPIVSGNGLPDPESIMQQARNYYADTKPYQITENSSGSFIEFCHITPAGADWHDNNKQKIIRHTGNEDETYPLHTVTKYKIAGNGVQKIGIHTGNSLEYISVTDEDGRETIRFYDAWKKLILERKVYNEKNNVFYDTHYVYDEMDNLRFVLSPEASSRMTADNTTYVCSGVNASVIDQYAYVYRYDAKRRCIAGKNPGADWIYLVYDQAGRVILTQDGNQRLSSTWAFCKYDRYGRIIQQGTTVTPKTHDTLQAEYANIVLKESWSVNGYSNNYSIGTETVILTENYYDNYEFLNLSAYSTIKTHLTYSEIIDFDIKCGPRMENGIDISTRGMQTGKSVSLTDQTGAIVTAVYYDDKGRVVQSLSNNHLNGYNKHYYSYNFSGSPTKHRLVQKAFSAKEVIENYTYAYDQAGRLKASDYTINAMPTLKMNSFQYDDLGRIKQKKFNNDAHAIGYTYNLHNQLKSISSSYFSQTLRYQDGTTQKYYNGNIAEIDETSLSSNPKLYHTYQYDGANRLTTDISGVTANGTLFGNTGNEFTTTYSYDRNGNITTLFRNGFVRDLSTGTPTPPVVSKYIDQLQIIHSGNQMTQAIDHMNTVAYGTLGNTDFKDRSGGSTEYLYDAVGNQTADNNKGIAWVKYNSLNLPYKIQMENGNKIEYLYSASGGKLKSIYSLVLNSMQIPLGNTAVENTTNIKSVSTRDYCGNMVYLNGKLERIYTPEGYVIAYESEPSMWKYVYHIKDYQGNVRAEVESDFIRNNIGMRPCQVRYSTGYYPYGMELTPKSGQSIPSPAPPNLYSGNEFERTNTQWHDFHNRWYDQQLGRFLTQDPLAAIDYSVSPYAYCGGDPINYVDPWGLFKFGSDGYYTTDEEPVVTYSVSVGGPSFEGYFNNQYDGTRGQKEYEAARRAQQELMNK